MGSSEILDYICRRLETARSWLNHMRSTKFQLNKHRELGGRGLNMYYSALLKPVQEGSSCKLSFLNELYTHVTQSVVIGLQCRP